MTDDNGAAAGWLLALRRYFDRFWNRALVAFTVAAERDQRDKKEDTQ